MNTRFLVAALGMASLFSTGAFADCRKRTALRSTAAGAGLDVSGQAEVREQGGRQKFKVSMDARVANGATFIVLANGAAAGTITIVAGDGELELKNYDGQTLPSAVNPVCTVGPVVVTDANGVAVLSGSF
ncbi:MAG: hypothetical protein JNK48_21650 [Bryobacterales bacterium]|nr:hypothetical protein [Bryobacterales bacterium]